MKNIEGVLVSKYGPCTTCVVKSMCNQVCNEFITYLGSFINLTRLPVNEQVEVATRILIDNNKFFKGLE